MKRILLVLLFSTSTLLAQRAPFAAQSDLAADLSDTVLNNIFHHRIGLDYCLPKRGVWVEGFGSYRRRASTSIRQRYNNWFGGGLGGLNYVISCNNYFNLILGGSGGAIDIHHEPSFDTYSVLFGMTWEQLCEHHFYGFAFIGGVLNQQRTVTGPFGTIHEHPRGVFITPEFTCSYQFDCICARPIFSATLRYAGFFVRDYQYREILGTLYVQKRSIQLVTLRGELAVPRLFDCAYWEPYLGVAGRFQFDDNHVHGHLLLDNSTFSDGIDNSIGYGLIGLRGSRQCGCLTLQLNFEGSYDSDQSWRTLGELAFNY